MRGDDSLPDDVEILKRLLAARNAELARARAGDRDFVSERRDRMRRTIATAGFGAHADPRVAVCRAILEVAQSRATDRQGDWEKQRHERPPVHHWLVAPSEEQWNFCELMWKSECKGVDINSYRQALGRAGLTEIAVIDFPTYPDLYVVRILAPGIETWHATAGESRLGSRLMRRLCP